MELKSLSQRIECARMESWCLGMIKECLDFSSMHLGVPFIAPRQLGAVGGILGRPKLPSVGWRTGQSGAPPDSTVHVRCTIFFHPWRSRPLQLWHRLAHRTLSGAHRTFRCPFRPLERATCRPRIWRPTVALAAVGSPDSPVNYSRTPPKFSREWPVCRSWPGAPDTVQCTTGQSDVPSRVESWLHTDPLFQSFLFLFLALR
jgi:hypothetical protein